MGMTPAKWQEFIEQSKQMRKQAAFKLPVVDYRKWKQAQGMQKRADTYNAGVDAYARSMSPSDKSYYHTSAMDASPNGDSYQEHYARTGQKVEGAVKQVGNFVGNALAPYLAEKAIQGTVAPAYATTNAIKDWFNGGSFDWWNRYGEFSDDVHNGFSGIYDKYDQNKTDIGNEQAKIDERFSFLNRGDQSSNYSIMDKTNDFLTIHPDTETDLPTREKSKYIPSAALNAGARTGNNLQRMAYWTALKGVPALGETVMNYTGDVVNATANSMGNDKPWMENYADARQRTRNVIQPAYDLQKDMSQYMDEKDETAKNYWYSPESGLVDRDDLIEHQQEYVPMEDAFRFGYDMAIPTAIGKTTKAIKTPWLATTVDGLNRARTGNPIFFGDFKRLANTVAPGTPIAGVFNTLGNRGVRSTLQYLADSTGMSDYTNVLTKPQKYVNGPFKNNLEMLASTQPSEYSVGPALSYPTKFNVKPEIPSYYDYPINGKPQGTMIAATYPVQQPYKFQTQAVSQPVQPVRAQTPTAQTVNPPQGNTAGTQQSHLPAANWPGQQQQNQVASNWPNQPVQQNPPMTQNTTVGISKPGTTGNFGTQSTGNFGTQKPMKSITAGNAVAQNGFQRKPGGAFNSQR